MSAERLKEITMSIVKLEGPLPVMNYIYSLDESDIYSFLDYVKNSKFNSTNVYSAIMRFSLDYLKGLGCPIAFTSSWNKEPAASSRKLW